jgi:16S rRNA (cytosine967-C5)-methyltransferase
MKTTNKNVREAVLELLETIEKNQAYSNLLLNKTIEKDQIASKDIGLLTEIVYGTLQRKMTLDFYLEPFLKDQKKLESWVPHLLRLTLYQMVYLDRVPDRAAIYEAVEIAKKRGHKGISNLVNGVLRNIQRSGLRDLADIQDPEQRLAIETSHPVWLVKRWVKELGYDRTKAMCEINITAPLQTARVNTTKITREECISLLEQEGYQVEISVFVPEAIKCLKGNLASSKAFKEGLLTIQDESSMLVAHALNVQPEEVILDACAAPGGKSTHIAEQLNNTGKVLSLDLHEHKVKLIQANAKRLGLANIETQTLDSRRVQEQFAPESFDRILLDAPCSGLGVMRRKPDMKYTKNAEDIDRLQTIQIKLLTAVAPLLKKDGILVYSTCTIDKGENVEVVEAFLQDHPDFSGDSTLISRMHDLVKPLINDYSLQILPQDFGSDGFYIACLRKKV